LAEEIIKAKVAENVAAMSHDWCCALSSLCKFSFSKSLSCI